MKRPTKNSTDYLGRLRKFLNVTILGIISALLVVSCASQQPVVQTQQILRTEQTIIRDTNIIIQPDSAAIRALFQCDSLNRVVLKSLEQKQGERIKPNCKTTANTDGSVSVDFSCNEDSLMLEIQLRDKIIQEKQNTVQTIQVEKHLNKWDAFCIVCGYILMGCLALGISIFIVKLFIR